MLYREEIKMATVIEVNGQKIQIEDKKAVTTESVVIYDEYESLAMATEALAMIDVMDKTLTAYAADCRKAMEAAPAPVQAGMGAKLATAAQAIWQKIVTFFKNIMQYISTFVQGQALKVRASMLMKKFNEVGKQLRPNKTVIDATNVESFMADRNAIGKVINQIKSLKDARAANGGKTWILGGDAMKYLANCEQQLNNVINNPATNQPKKHNVADIVKKLTGGNVEGFLTGVTNGSIDSFAVLKNAHNEANASQKQAMAIAKDGGDQAITKKYTLLSKAINYQTKLEVKRLSYAMKAIGAMLGGETQGTAKQQVTM